jgi:beta-lactamase regulating signal transducer with metallopeptidase domain
MFKTLMVCIVIGFIGLLAVALYKIFEQFEYRSKEPPKTTADEIEELITKIKVKITQADLDQLSGIDGAEKELQYWKDQLAQTQQLKEKTRNL